VARHDDRDQCRIDELRGLHQIDSIRPGHLQIREQQVEAALAHRGQRLGGRCVPVCLITLVLQGVAKRPHGSRLVIDDEQAELACGFDGGVGTHGLRGHSCTT
jgi:hypothetical protein